MFKFVWLVEENTNHGMPACLPVGRLFFGNTRQGGIALPGLTKELWEKSGKKEVKRELKCLINRFFPDDVSEGFVYWFCASRLFRDRLRNYNDVIPGMEEDEERQLLQS